jgi:hypothetical protein
VLKRAEQVPPKGQNYCEKNPMDEQFLLYGDGGGLLMEKDY